MLLLDERGVDTVVGRERQLIALADVVRILRNVEKLPSSIQYPVSRK
jgi:hypothetical protein